MGFTSNVKVATGAATLRHGCYTANNVTPLEALESARQMKARAAEMVEASGRMYERARRMRNRIDGRSESAKKSMQVVLCKLWEMRAESKNRKSFW